MKRRSLLHSSLTRALDAVWLRQPDSLRIPVPSELQPSVRQELACARARLRDARQSEPGGPRDEIVTSTLLELLGVVGRVSGTPSVDSASRLQAGAERVRAGLPRQSLAELLSVTDSGKGPAPLTERQFRDGVELCEWVDGLLDTRSGRARRLERKARWLVPIAAIIALGFSLLGPRNVASAREVTASSICYQTPPPRSLRPELSRVVDGVRYEGPAFGQEYGSTAFALCTNQEVHPWVTVDLGRQRVLSDAAVYGRTDCCWGDGLPLALQISSDNVHFETVATTNTPFTAVFGWKTSLEGVRARYVRLYGPASSPTSIVVSEIEVHGH